MASATSKHFPSIDILDRHLSQFANILLMATSTNDDEETIGPTLSSWKSTDFERAMQWATYFETLFKRIETYKTGRKQNLKILAAKWIASFDNMLIQIKAGHSKSVWTEANRNILTSCRISRQTLKSARLLLVRRLVFSGALQHRKDSCDIIVWLLSSYNALPTKKRKRETCENQSSTVSAKGKIISDLSGFLTLKSSTDTYDKINNDLVDSSPEQELFECPEYRNAKILANHVQKLIDVFSSTSAASSRLRQFGLQMQSLFCQSIECFNTYCFMLILVSKDHKIQTVANILGELLAEEFKKGSLSKSILLLCDETIISRACTICPGLASFYIQTLYCYCIDLPHHLDLRTNITVRWQKLIQAGIELKHLCETIKRHVSDSDSVQKPIQSSIILSMLRLQE